MRAVTRLHFTHSSSRPAPDPRAHACAVLPLVSTRPLNGAHENFRIVKDQTISNDFRSHTDQLREPSEELLLLTLLTYSERVGDRGVVHMASEGAPRGGYTASSLYAQCFLKRYIPFTSINPQHMYTCCIRQLTTSLRKGILLQREYRSGVS